MAASFLYKLFTSTIGSMPAQYDHHVDTWWGVFLTEMGVLDPFREENRSHFLVKFLGTLFLGLFLCALSVCNAYKNIKHQQDEVRIASRKGADEVCDLGIKLRDTENKLCLANEKLEDADSDMEEERKGFRDTIQGLNDQHLVDQDKIRSLEQDVWNTESDRDTYSRQVSLVSKENQKLKRDLSEAETQRDLAQGQVQTLQEDLAEATRQRDLAQAEVQKLSIQAEPQQGQATSVGTTLKARPKPKHRRTQRPSSLPKFHKRLSPKGSKSAKSSSFAIRDQKIIDLEQENGTLTAQIGGLRTDLGTLSTEHGECNGHLHTQLAKKDEELRNLQASLTTADERSTETIASLQTKLEGKNQEVADLEEANKTLVAGSAASSDTVQRLNTLSNELEMTRSTLARCDKTSKSQSSKIDQLVTAKDELEATLRDKDGEIKSLQEQFTPLHNELAELQETHAKCGEHANAQGVEMTQLRNANASLQGTNEKLCQQLKIAENEHAALMQAGQQLEKRNQTLQELQACNQRETRSLQGQVEALNQTVDHQRQRIQTLETNCPRCQKLREALDAVKEDVEMSDDNARAEMKREVAAELRSQVADDVRRQIRSEVERELREKFQNHYSDLLAQNTKRIRQQDRLLLEKDARLEQARNAPNVNHAACEKREANLQSKITKLQQDANIAQGSYSRLSGDAKHDRSQFNHAQTTIDNLRSELETIKADQRRALNVNPLQSKLTSCQRELNTMKEDRKKARDNCSIYSNQLSDLRKRFQTLENELAALKEKSSLNGDSMVVDGRTEDVQSSGARAMDRDEAAARDLLRREVELREARDGKKKASSTQSALATPAVRSTGDSSERSAQESDKEADDKPSLMTDGGKMSDAELEEREILDTRLAPKTASKSARRLGRRPIRQIPRQCTTNSVIGEVAGMKRGHDECSDGEADDEGDDDRKKVKIGDDMLRLKVSADSSKPAQLDKPQEDKDME